MIIFFIILFISDFNLIYNRTDKISSELNIFIDNSLSSNEINNSNDYLTTIIKSIDNYKDSINKKINYYSFGSHLKLIDNFNQIKLDEKSTDITEVIKLINNSVGSSNIIITDGNLNNGVEVSKNIIADKNRLFVIATSEIEDFDVRIDNFSYQNNFSSNDSLFISFDVISKLPEKHNAKIFINSSPFLNNNFEMGKKTTSFKKKISTDLIKNGINEIEISSFNNENDIENNKINFSYKEHKKNIDVALLSGNISKNTSTIKNILNSFPNLKLQHIYRLSDDESISSIGLLNDEFDLFIFDNFPYSGGDLLIANKIIDRESKIVFFDSNDISERAIAFFQKIPNLEIVKNIEGQRFKNIDSKRFNVPSQHRSYNWYNNEESLISYNDHSIAVDQYNNLLLVLITDLNKLYLNKNISFDINYFYSYLNDIIINDFYYEKKKFQISNYRKRYFLNEFVNISIIYDNIYNNQIINIEVKNSNDVLALDKIKLSGSRNQETFSTSFDSVGEYKIIFYTEENIGLDSIDVYVSNEDIELAYLNQNNDLIVKLLDNNQDNYYSYLDTDYLLSSIVYNDKIITKDINLRIFDYLYFLLLIATLYVIDLLVRRKLYLL